MDEKTLKVVDDVSSKLMDFVCHNQRPYSKQLQRFIATGMHDVRAHLVAFEIVREVREALLNDDPDSAQDTRPR